MLAFQINRDAPKVIAEKAREFDIPFIHFSTDYVFDGEKEGHIKRMIRRIRLVFMGNPSVPGRRRFRQWAGRFISLEPVGFIPTGERIFI